MPTADFRWDSDSILAAFACRLDGINYSNLKRIYPDTPEKEYEDMTVLKFLHRTHSGTDVYNGGTYIDVFNPEATKKFMELTHEKYKEYCGTRFGNEIKGIFTDEPHRGGLFTDFDGNPHGVGNNTRTVPWTPRMADEYRARFGGDLIADLPKLFLREDGQRISPVKWQYCELAESLFLENFAKPQYDWCTENGIAYTGHVLHEDNLTSQVAMQGSLMRYYQYMHIPGMDLLTEGCQTTFFGRAATREKTAPFRNIRRYRLAVRFPGTQSRRRLAGTLRGKYAVSPFIVVHDAGRSQTRLPGEHILPVGMVA